MNRALIWDLPTRLFHWLLAGGFAAAAAIALLLDEDGPLFPYHAILGLTIALMVCLRVVWGLIGTRYARLGSFIFGPTAVIDYFKGALAGGGRRYLGHNPGSSLAIFAILLLVLAMAFTGLMLGRGDESVKELHEVLAYTLVGFAIAHVIGVALHTFRHRENITASMIHGRKDAESEASIPSSRPVVAVIFLIIVGAWAMGLVHNFDPSTKLTRLPLIGTELQVGEVENEREGYHQGNPEREQDGDD